MAVTESTENLVYLLTCKMVSVFNIPSTETIEIQIPFNAKF